MESNPFAKIRKKIDMTKFSVTFIDINTLLIIT